MILSANFRKKLYTRQFILLALIIIAIVVGLQKYFNGHFGNYTIFTTSFWDLHAGRDLYTNTKAEFLYSPAFAVLMAPFAMLPDWLGIITWCLVNSMVVYSAIVLFPGLSPQKKTAFLGIIFFEFITAQQNLQTNPIIGALIVLAFVAFEKGNTLWAALFIVLTFYIKIYGIVAAALFLFYPEKLKFILYFIFWSIVLFLLPMVFVSLDQLIALYKSWFNFTMVQHDNASVNYSSSLNSKDPSLSLMSMLHAWFGVNWPSLYVQLTGGLLLMLPFARIKEFANRRFRELLVASVLIFCTIFNHMAESCSFVVAIFGVAIWFLGEEKNRFTITLFVLAFLFTSLSPTDIFPRFVRETFVKPYVLKAAPCVFIWILIQYRLLSESSRSEDREPAVINTPA